MVHEVTHVLDRGKSGVQSWKDAVAKDSCVLTAYGNTNYVENFAVIAPLVLLENLDPAAFQRLKSQYPNFGCLQNQLDYARQQLKDLWMPGGTCGPRVDPPSPTVPLPRKARGLDGRPIKEVQGVVVEEEIDLDPVGNV